MSRHPLKSSRCASWLLAVSLGACTSAKDPLGSDDPSRDASADERVCKAGERPAMGNRVDADDACIGASSVLGCLPRERACDDAETVVRGWDGTLWWLSNLCIPEGFGTLPDADVQKILSYPRCGETSGPDAPTTPECGGMGRQRCAVGECPLQAQRVDEARSCLQKSERVGCWPSGSSCRPVIQFARDTDGVLWSFRGGCIPQGFTGIEDRERAQLSNLSDCGPDSTPAVACAARSVGACSGDPRCTLADGIMYFPTRHCRWPEPVEVACVDFTQGCSTVVTHATNPEDRAQNVQFPDSCIPPDWEREPDRALVDDWPICPEVPVSTRGGAAR